MIKFIFEDSDDTPSSVLLKSSFNGANIEFANGSSRVYRKVLSLRCVSDIDYCIVFFDVAPDNRYTISRYRRLIEDLNEAEIYFPVYVVPIPCIEYVILKLFCSYSYISCSNRIRHLIRYLVEEFNWGIAKAELGLNYNGSIEKVYKFLLANQSMLCLRNTISDKNKLSGKFYIKDCDCEERYCRLRCIDSLRLKAERLYTSLPIFDIISKEHAKILYDMGIVTQTLSIGELRLKQSELYKDICTQLGVSGFVVM